MTQSQLTAGKKKTEDEGEIVDPVMGLCSDIRGKLPPSFDIEGVAKNYPVLYTNSMNTVLRQEMIRFNRLLEYIKISLNDVKRAIAGQIAMIPELENVHISMSLGRIPDAWANRSYPSLKPLGSYVNDFVARLQFLQNWIDNGEPFVYWLSGFYFTQSFLTGVLQNHSRKNKLQIDLLTMQFEVTDLETEATEASELGVYIKVIRFPSFSQYYSMLWLFTMLRKGK